MQDNDVFAFLVTGGNVWIGNQGGIAIYKGMKQTVRSNAFDQNNGMPNPKVRAMVELNGSIYVGTWGGGIGVYDIGAGTWTTLNTTDGLVNDEVAQIKVHNGTLFIATNDGVSMYTPASQTWQKFDASDSLSVPLVSALDVATTPRGEERFYTPRIEYGIDPRDLPKLGATLQRGSTVIWYTTLNSGLNDLNINDVMYNADDDTYLLGTTVSGIAVVSVANSTWSYITTKNGLPSNQVYSITRVGTTLWVATQDGIARQKSDGSWQGYNRGGGLKEDRVRVVYSDNGVRLWLGYISGGAGRVDPASAQ